MSTNSQQQQQQQQQHQGRGAWTYDFGSFREGSRRYDTRPRVPAPEKQQLKPVPPPIQTFQSEDQQKSLLVQAHINDQQRFSPTMNRQHRSATVGSDESSPPPVRDLPDAVLGYGSPLARGRANRRRSTLHNILERSKKRLEEQQQQQQQQQQQEEEESRPSTTASAFQNYNGIGRSAKGLRRHAHQLSITDSLFTMDGAQKPQQTRQDVQQEKQQPELEESLAQSLPRETSIAPVRTVHKAELQFRRQTPPPQPRSSPIAGARQLNRSSPMQKRAEQHLRLKTASRGSRESMEKGSASRESIDRLSTMQPRALAHKRGGSNPFRIERTYRTAERAKDSDCDDDGDNVRSSKDADTPSTSPVVPTFTLPAVQTPPAPKDLPPLPAKLQKQLSQLPRLSPPRKLVLANNPNLQLGLPEPGLPISPAAMSQSSSRRVISGSSLLRSPSKASFTDNPPSQNMHVLGPNPPESARIGKGQASEVFRRVGYWLYSTAPVQFIKHAMVEERLDSVNVLYSTERSIWILGVSYRLKKNTKNVILPAAIEADSSHLHVDSSLFLSHHHQKRSASPSNSHHLRKPEIMSQRRSEDISSRRRANTSGVMLNKKKLQSIAQLQSYPAMPTIPDASSQAATVGKLGVRTLASIPSQDFLKSKRAPATPISPMPFPDDPAEDSSRFGLDTDYDVDIESDAAAANGRRNAALQQPHLQAQQERPKSSKMNRLRSWVARTTNPIRRKSDVVIDVLASPMNPAHQPGKDGGLMTATGCASPYVASARPTSPQPHGHPAQSNRTSLEGYRSSSQMSTARDTVRSTGAISNGMISGSGSDPRGLGIGPPIPATRLRRKSRETMSTMSGSHKGGVDGQRRSWVDMDGNVQGMPPMPVLSDPLAPLASAGIPHDRMAHGKLNTSLLSAAQQQRRPMSSHSSVSQRIASNGGLGNSASSNTAFGPSRREANVRALISDFAVWESPSASIMMFQREWKLPSFQQLVTIQAASSWAKSCGWAVTLSSETFFMAYIFYKLPKDVSATQSHAPGEKIVGDRLLLRMRLAMEDIESKAIAGETWRDAITAIILTIDARVAPKCPVVGAKRNMSMGSAEISESSELHDDMTPEDHVRRMKMLEKHLAKVTESFSTHFWPRQEDCMPIFNTFPRRRTDEANGGTVIERKTIRRTHGWNMIPTLLTFRSDDAEQQQPDAQSMHPAPPESPTSSSYTRKRHLYPMGLSITGSSPGSTSGAVIGEHHGTSFTSSHDLSTIDSASGTPACHSQTPSQPPSPRSPPLSAMVVSPVSKRSSTQSHGASKPCPRPVSPVHKRGALGISTSGNDAVASLSEDFGQSLSMLPRPPLQSASSQSSGASSGFNVNMNAAACSSLSISAAGSAGGLGIRHPGSMASSMGLGIGANGRQRKRKAGEAGVVGKTKGGFEVVWSATDAMSTSYVMVPVPKAATPESPTKMLKQNHSRFNLASDADTVGTQSQPNLKRVLESITREINLDSSYVLLLPPPPPIELGAEEDDNDEFGYLATTLLRRVKSEIVMRRTLQEFEHEYGLDLIDEDDGNDSDSFQMINSSDGGSGNNSVYFSAEDDSMLEPETWYKRLSSSSSQHHLPSRHRLQQHHNAQITDSVLSRPQPLSLNQLTLLEFFMDGMRRFYFTYRKGFPTITPSFYTSDMGWGCTYRTCQMMLAESFARVLLGRFWDPFRLSASERVRHGRIIEWFHDSDSPKAFYSIHRMARTATAMDKRIGDWLGPSIAAHVMKRLSNQHSNCPLTIHVAIDQTVYASEVRKQGLSHYEEGAEQPSWRPLLLLVPVRLGLSRLNLGYIPKIKTLFQIPQSVGLVGGKPSRSFYFIGRQGDSLFYLDPHVTRQHVPSSGTLEAQHLARGDVDGNESADSDASSDFEMLGIAETEEYHTTHISSMPIHRLDPSMLLGFLFNTESEWDTFVMAATDKESQRSICTGASPLFTLLSGSSMMTPQFESLVQPIPGHVTKVSAIPNALNIGGRKSPRVNSDSVIKSPRQPQTPAMSPLAAPPPPLHRMRSASSPRFESADIKGAHGPGDFDGEDDEFEML
ncbi:hypothetical protein LPJ75_000833 [Coemansia sp. RSA 2598]|nr:hypothetical protein LPJ75_000833 [Coemansia sp. RSA 2598]